MKKVSVLMIVCGLFLFITSDRAFAGSIEEGIKSQIKLDYDWYTTAGDSIMKADFTIDNRSSYAIKDITIKCIHSAKSGTAIDSNTRTIYDIVKAKKKKKFKKFSMGFIHSQAAGSSCSIVDFKVWP